MEEEHIIKHTKALLGLSKDRDRKWGSRLKEVVTEILIIVFAVSISIWFHNWAESWKDRGEEREFYTGLKKDLLADLNEMTNDDLPSYRKFLRGVNYFEKVGSGAPVDNDSVAHYQTIFFSNVTFSPREGRFDALRGSGRLDIIRNKELLIDITDLYTKVFPSINISNDYLNAMRNNNLFPFVASHLQLDAGGKGTNWEELLRTSQMRILLNLCERSTSTDEYSALIEKCNAIIRQLDEELAR
jgi:uncharacterized protein DUF6090